MPLYEYICESCGRTIEAFQNFSEAPLTLCGRCGGKLKRLISPPAVRFKGSGWYVSDYKRSGATKESSDGGKAEGESPKESSSKEASGGTAPTTDASKKDS
jgi:putative FmdB family regulatory protein